MTTKTAAARAARMNLDLSTATLAGVARRAIIAGRSNAEVLSTLKEARPSFPHRKHSHYARWYRAQLVMLGVISKSFAASHS